MEQVQDLHAGWRPDVYRAGVTVLTPDYFGELVHAGQVLVYEEKGCVAGVVIYRERQAGGPVKMERKTLYIDSIAVDEAHRGGASAAGCWTSARPLPASRDAAAWNCR